MTGRLAKPMLLTGASEKSSATRRQDSIAPTVPDARLLQRIEAAQRSEG